MEKQLEVIVCSFPKCGCRGLVDYFFVPSRDEVKKINEGTMPKAADLSRFAVCDRHVAVIRKDGIQCWPLQEARQAVEDDEARQLAARQAAERWQEAQRKAKQLAIFQPKGKVTTGVGQGLGRFRKYPTVRQVEHRAHAIH